MTPKEIMQKAINTYGLEKQMIKTVEELAELSQALCKSFIRLTDYDPLASFQKDLESINNIFEEMADVEIMLAQCKMMFECEDEVQDWKDKKLKRLQKRLEG